MIQFRYKNFNAPAPTQPANTGDKFGNILSYGLAGMQGLGMIAAHKQGKAAEQEHKQNMAAMAQKTREINNNLKSLERNFGIPGIISALGGTAGAVSTGMMGAGMVQSHFQGKKQAEMAQEQVAAQDRQTQAIQKQNAVLKRLEERAAKTPEKASVILSPGNIATAVNKQFSSVLKERHYGVGKNITTAVKDLWKAGKGVGIKGSLKSNLALGATAAGATYAVNKYISHDMKKSGLSVDENGNLVKRQKSYAAVPGGVLAKVKKGALSKVKDSIGGPLMTVGFESPRAFGYLEEKRRLKDQIRGTERTYSATSILGKAKAGITKFGKTPLRSTLGGILKFGSFGTLNTSRVQKYAGNLAANADSKTLRKVGKWATEHQTLANAAALAPGVLIGQGAFNVGSKLVSKPLRKIDPEAYKYQDAKDRATKEAAKQSKKLRYG
jgi:hypothetical protein